MLTELQLANFKAWRDTEGVRLAPITVFFGSNSAGKSSLLQFLLMLKQTAESPDRHRVLHPGDRNTPVELGTYRDLIFNHDVTQQIRFSLEWSLPEPLGFRDPLTRKDFSGTSVWFSASIMSDPKGALQHVHHLEYTLKDDGLPRVYVKLEAKDEKGLKYSITAQKYELRRNQGRVWTLPGPIRYYGFPDEVGAYYQNAGFTSDLALALEQQLKRLQYLGPLRDDPERSYIWSGEEPDHVGWFGERAIEAMLAATTRSISPGYKRKAQPFQAVVARWLQQLGLLDSFEVRPIAEHRKEYEVWVRTNGAKQFVNLPDVGFGVSQVLPVIIQCFYASPNTTLILEQPEIHLHPHVQTALADLFIETVQSRENGKDRNIQLIVESHSEHFLRRLQRRLAEKVVRPEDVALYFCTVGEQGASLQPLEVDQYGEIKNWPDNFFGDEMIELAARMQAAAERELGEKP
jgi:predicted ATPase